MGAKTTYELTVKLGAAASPSWKTILGKAEARLSGLNSLSNKVMAGIAAGTAASAATATMAIANMTEVYTGFESEMATVKSISGATAQQYLAMKDAALEAGRSTVFTAEESASALEYMSLAGWDAEESIAGLTPMLKLAAATGKELQTTSDLVTDSMSALGLEVTDLDMYLDKLVKGNNEANNTAEQLMQGLVKSGGAARALGADLDDTITALGIMADNGTKGEEAGTALNAILSRLAGNTTALKELDKLHVDLWDDKGEFVGFEESLIRINRALSGLTAEDRALSMKNIAGTHHFSQMEYLLDAVNEVTDENGNAVSAWEELESQVADSSGALENMYDITTDTLLFAQKRLTSAKEDMQIRIADVFADDAKDFLTWLSEKLPNATDSIVAFAEAHEGEFADALEKVGEGIEMLWENGIAAGQWLIKHKKAVVGGLIGIAGSIGLVKAAMLGINIAKFLTNPLSAAGAVAGLAITAIGAVAGAIRDAETAAVNADLAEHFGNISLSLSEIEAVAESIVSSECLEGVEKALEEFDDLDAISEKIEDEVDMLQKLNWKVSIGLELTEGEQNDYKQAIESFVKNAQEYALQAQYAVSLSMEFDFVEEGLEQSNITDKVNQFYADKYQELSDLGTKLNQAVTDAFNDGLLEPQELDVITRIQADMAEIEKALAIGNYEAELSLLEMEYSGKDLDYETVQRLNEQLNEENAAAIESYQREYAKMHSIYTNAYEGGGLTDEEYEAAIQNIENELARGRADIQIRSMRFLLNTINNTYGDEIGQYQDTVARVLDEYNGLLFNREGTDLLFSQEGKLENSDPQYVFNAIIGSIAESGLDKTQKKAIATLLEPMEGSFEKLEELRGKWGNLTPEMQQTLLDMYAEIYQLKGMAVYEKGFNRKVGDVEGLQRDVVNKIEDLYGLDPLKYDHAKEYIDYYYEELTGYTENGAASSLAESLETAKTGTVEPLVEGIYEFTQESMNRVFGRGLEATTEFDLTIRPSSSSHFSGVSGMEYHNLDIYPQIMSNAEGGIYSSPILTTFAEKSPEAAVPLDGSVRAKNIWVKAGQILGMLPQGNRDRSILAGISGGQQETGTGGTIQLYYNQVVNIQGNASEENIQRAFSIGLDELREMLAELQREDRRTAFM